MYRISDKSATSEGRHACIGSLISRLTVKGDMHV